MNLPYTKAIYSKPEIKAVLRALGSELLSGHKETSKFEEELAEWWGMKYAVSTNSGSSANFIAVQALDLPKGSEVITPAGGAFPTTVNPIIYHGLKPVFVDIDIETLCIKEGYLPMTTKTKGLMFAHTLGRSPDMKWIAGFKEKFNLKVIEDCCDAMSKGIGTIGDMATVSFYPAHLMTTGGEGGAILTNDYSLYRKCRSIRDWGRACHCRWGHDIPACGDRFKNPDFDHRYYYTDIGGNWKMTEMQAAFGREQLKRVDGFIEKRKRNYDLLYRAMQTQDILIPEWGYKRQGVPFCFPFLTDNKQEVMIKLAEAGIGVRTIFTGNILKHPAYKDIDCRIVGELPNSNRLFKESVFVGVGPHLTIKDMEYIAKTLKEIL